MHEANKDLAERLRSPPSEPFTRAKGLSPIGLTLTYVKRDVILADLKVPNRGGVRFGSEPEIIPDFLEDPEPRSYSEIDFNTNFYQ